MSRIASVAAALSIFTMGCTASTRESDVPTNVASPTTDATPRRVEVADGAGKAAFDDLRFSATLRRVLVAPGNARFSLIEPATLGRTPLGSVSRSTRSSDEARGLIVAADGDTNDVVVIDPASDRLLGRAKIAAAPDYVRWSASTNEVWVTEPARDGIEIFSLPEGSTTPVSTGFVSVEGGPEGIVFDAKRGRAYAHRFDGPVVAIDLAARKVIATWSTGCKGAHGIPALDEERGFLFAGCRDAELVALDVTSGREVSRYALPEGGESIVAYSAKLGHVYLRGDPGTSVAVLGVSDHGTLSPLGTLTASPAGHGMAADEEGNVWVCDATHGAVLGFRDGFPAAR